MPDLINGLFGNTAAETQQAQQSQQQQAQQFSSQQLQQLLAQQQQAQQQAMQRLQQYLQTNPNPAQGWGPVVGPQNTAPATLGGGTIGANGSPQGPIGAQALGQMPTGDPNSLALLHALLSPPTPPPAQATPPPRTTQPVARKNPPEPGGGGPRNPHGQVMPL